MNDFTEMKRLSVYVQHDNPQKLLEISIKLADGIMAQLEANRQRNLLTVRNIYIFLIMYCFLTKDLYLFTRIFTSLENVQLIFSEAVSFSEGNDCSADKSLLMQFKAFYNEHNKSFLPKYLALAQTLESRGVFVATFESVCKRVAGEYLDDLV